MFNPKSKVYLSPYIYTRNVLPVAGDRQIYVSRKLQIFHKLRKLKLANLNEFIVTVIVLCIITLEGMFFVCKYGATILQV